MKNYCHSQLVHLLPLYSVKAQKGYYFPLGEDGKTELVGTWHDSCKAAEVLALSARTSAAITHRQARKGLTEGATEGSP